MFLLREALVRFLEGMWLPGIHEGCQELQVYLGLLVRVFVYNMATNMALAVTKPLHSSS